MLTPFGCRPLRLPGATAAARCRGLGGTALRRLSVQDAAGAGAATRASWVRSAACSALSGLALVWLATVHGVIGSVRGEARYDLVLARQQECNADQRLAAARQRRTELETAWSENWTPVDKPHLFGEALTQFPLDDPGIRRDGW